jgi:predicted phage-related endonuclease
MTNNTNSVNSGAMPKIDRTAMMTRDRRQFIGGSDARIIMGKDEKSHCAFGRKNEGKRLPLICPGF